MYGLKSVEYISKELNRPPASIEKMAESIFPIAKRTGPWTAPEVQRMKQYLGICEVEIIARIFGRSIADVQNQIDELDQCRIDVPWTQEETAEFKRMYGTRTDEDIARVFGRTEEAVADKATELCLAKDKAFVRKVSGEETITKMPRWSAAEIEQLRELYADNSNLEIAQALNRSVKSVVSKAHNIGLKKDPHRLQEMGRQNVSLRYNRQTGAKVQDASEDTEGRESHKENEGAAGGTLSSSPPSSSEPATGSDRETDDDES
jgi:hypothetical protein